MKPQLFYQIADPGGAVARKQVIARGLLERVQFRNLHYDEVRVDLEAYRREAGRSGEATLPALWDGQRLHEGLDAVLAAIDKMG